MSATAKKFLVASVIYFGLGLAAQTVAGFDLWLGFNPVAYTTVIALEKIFLLGWLAQLVLALAYDRWLEPVQASERETSTFSGLKSGKAVFTLFNLGLPLVILGQPGVAIGWGGGPWVGPLAALGSLLQLLAGLIFFGQVRRQMTNDK